MMMTMVMNNGDEMQMRMMMTMVMNNGDEMQMNNDDEK